jgi:nicotinate-nucleotide adenylyltransferase
MTVTRPGSIGVLGGTLDPIHVGHVATAIAARTTLGLERVIVIPVRMPPHRQSQPVASGFHRFAMAVLSAADYDWMIVSDDELRADGPSFTANTLDRLRGSGLGSQVFFITGADAFAEIETWHRFPEVLDLAHFAVVSRPGMPVAGLATRLPSLKSRFVPASSAGESGGRPAIFLVDAVTPNVSSTEVRRRLAAGETVAGLVCPAVEQHIRRHRLYGPRERANHLHGED